jgi:hypothetical protein
MMTSVSSELGPKGMVNVVLPITCDLCSCAAVQPPEFLSWVVMMTYNPLIFLQIVIYTIPVTWSRDLCSCAAVQPLKSLRGEGGECRRGRDLGRGRDLCSCAAVQPLESLYREGGWWGGMMSCAYCYIHI